jgi:hypothetical protein
MNAPSRDLGNGPVGVLGAPLPWAGRLTIDDDIEHYQAVALERGWGDGLPLIPPTPARVEQMLGAQGADAGKSLGRVPPSWREVTLGSVAINAVMAGCLPEWFSVVCAAVAGVLEPTFNLYGIQATTNPVAPLVVLNGPGAAALGFNSQSNAFGTGWRANATVGRALRLVMSNIGDAKPDGNDRATHGFPGKFTFCVAENESANPWQPLHVERGFDAADTTVTVMGTAQFHNIVEFVADDPFDILDALAANLAVPGTNNISYGGEPALALCPEHAQTIARAGLSKAEVKHYLFERARCDLRSSPPAVQQMLRSRRPAWCDLARWPICDRPEDLIIFVCGGAGTHSISLPSFGPTTAITTRVELV